MTILDPDPPVNPGEIDQLEQELGMSLPTDYRRFLLMFNGGQPEPSGFYFEGKPAGYGSMFEGPRRYDSECEHFFGFNDVTWKSLRWNRAVLADRMPPELLPIGDAIGGNVICLGIAGPNRGKIFFWEHEEEVDEGEVAGYQNVYDVAESFDAFLNSLQEFDEE